MTWSDFVTRFRADFAADVELQQFTREFFNMRQTTESVVEITTKFKERPYWCLSMQEMRRCGRPTIMIR